MSVSTPPGEGATLEQERLLLYIKAALEMAAFHNAGDVALHLNMARNVWRTTLQMPPIPLDQPSAN